MPDATLVSGSYVLNRNRPHFCPSPNIIWKNKLRRIRWERDVAYTSVKRNTYKILIGEHEEKKLGRQKRKLQHIVTIQALYE
jgi:hypothetical protein